MCAEARLFRLLFVTRYHYPAPFVPAQAKAPHRNTSDHTVESLTTYQQTTKLIIILCNTYINTYHPGPACTEG